MDGRRRQLAGRRLRRTVAHHSDREVLGHLLFDELVDPRRVHLEVHGAGREHFDEREALALLEIFDALEDRALRRRDPRGRREGDALDVDGRFEAVDEFADPHRVAVGLDVAPVGAGGRDLPGQRGGRHLAAGHAVVRVVDEEHGHAFAAVRRLDELVEADGGEVAVALIADDVGLGVRPSRAGADRGSAAVRHRDRAEVEVVVREDRAPDRHDEVSILLDAVVLDRLGDEFMEYAVAAAGAVMHVGLDRSRTAVEGIEKYF